MKDRKSSTTAKSNLLELRGITKTYISGETKFDALKGVDLSIKEGEFISITGPSGTGKSTLMHIIGLLDNPTSGNVIVEGEDVSHLGETNLAQIRNKALGFVFQQFNLLAKTPALDNVILPLLYSDVPLSLRHKLGMEMLKKVNLEDKKNNLPSQLSGGQQQRVAIARALINNPKIILADEPTGNLDSKSGREVIELLCQLNENDGRTIIIVTHDMEIAKTARRMVVIRDGRVAEDKTI